MRYTDKELKEIGCEKCKSQIKTELSEPVYKAKAFKMGTNHLAIMLPTQWYEKNNIKAGDIISLGVL